MRRPLVAFALALTCCSGGSQRHASVMAIADEYHRRFLQARPLTAFFRGIPEAPLVGLDNNSLADTERWRRQEDTWLAELRRLDPAPREGSTEGVLYQLLVETLTSSIATRVCHTELWPVRQLGGVQQLPTSLAGLQPVGNEKKREHALSRVRSFASYVDHEITALRTGIRKGYTAPRGNVESVLKQLDALLAMPAESASILRLAERDSAPEFRSALVSILRADLYPAFQRYREFLRTEYLPKARITTAISDIPGGKDCYRARVRAFTTLDLTPEAVHRLGLEEMSRIEAELSTITQRRFGTSELPALFDRLRATPEFRFTSRTEVLDTARAALDRVRSRLHRWFGRLPRAEMVLDACLPFEEESGCPNSYVAAAHDGSRPGRWRINTSPGRASRVDLEGIAFHEGYPGHHLQAALAQERPGAHPVGRLLVNSGFGEGWGLYAERLANEMGAYSGELAQVGRLSGAAVRAARLVVDPGLHALGWSREQAIEYMVAHTVLPRQAAVAEVDRYIINPGQATAYMVGRIEIERLRRQAEERLGTRFDIRAFHDQMLLNGNVPLPLLGRLMDAWMDSVAGR